MASAIKVYQLKTSISEGKSDKLRLGALFYNTADWSSIKRSYRVFTLAILTIVSAIMVLKLSFSLQSVLLQVVFMTNLVYLVAAKPHPSASAAVPDTLAGLGLLVAVLYQLGLTRCTLDGGDRFRAGLAFNYFCLAAFSASFIALVVLQGHRIHQLKLLYKQRKLFRD